MSSPARRSTRSTSRQPSSESTPTRNRRSARGDSSSNAPSSTPTRRGAPSTPKTTPRRAAALRTSSSSPGARPPVARRSSRLSSAASQGGADPSSPVRSPVRSELPPTKRIPFGGQRTSSSDDGALGRSMSSPARFNAVSTDAPAPRSGFGSRTTDAQTPKRTPTRGLRSELGTSRVRAAPPPGPSGGDGPDGGDDGDGPGPSVSTDAPDAGHRSLASDIEKAVVWGTTVNVSDCMAAFRNFFNGFQDHVNEGEYLYPRMLAEMKDDQSYNLNLDCLNLFEFDPELYKQLVAYPAEVIPIFDLVINEIFNDFFPEVEMAQRISVRTFNLRLTKSMRDLNPVDIGQMVSIQGMITRVAPVTPSIKRAFFRCQDCGHVEDEEVDRDQVVHPTTCSNCKNKHSFQLVHNRSMFSDVQTVKLQETPEVIPQGETPQTVHLRVYDDLVDVAKPGDRVIITGIYRAAAQKVNPARRAIKTVYRTFVDVIHFQKHSVSRFDVEDPSAKETQEEYTSFNEAGDMRSHRTEREKELIELGNSDDIYNKLTHSLAPSIYEMDDVKRGILCMLFGGTRKEIDAHGSTQKCRGEINILLCGDPGTSKSQLLQFVHKTAPRGIYTSGRGSSAVGLTAYVTRDTETGDFILESGALVLSDRGVCCIDEFDKMGDQTRAILHEAMEQQTVSIAKAGIVASLNARTSILASANPIESRYNPRMSVVENIDLPPTLLSRFDIIYLVLDKANETSDRKLARHLVRLYYENPTIENAQTMIDMKTLTEYISFARRKVHPQLSDEAVHDLVDAYVQMRTTGSTSQTRGRKTISATPRQLESLIRISEALARMRLSEVVERHDVAEAVRLMVSALQGAATDPTTGLIDMDIIATGHSATQRARLEQIKEELQALLADSAQATHKLSQLFNTLREAAPGLDLDEVREAVYSLRDDDTVTLTGDRRDPTVRVA